MAVRRILLSFACSAMLVGMLPATQAWAEQTADPPARVARMGDNEGSVTFAPAGETEWTDAQPNRPLARGDRLWTDKGSRAAVQVGGDAVYMDGQTQLAVSALDDRSAQLSVTQGSVAVRVRTLPEGENFEIDTPNLAFRAAYPGDFRIDVDPLRGTTRVTIESGTGAVYGDSGQSITLGGGQQVVFRARSLAKVTTQESPPRDNFDHWAAERNRREDQSVSARYLPRDVVGYQQLDATGVWSRDPKLGAVWTPQGVPANWAPYRTGRWEWIAPWGWTWIDDAPWAFAPSHYGRWALLGNRWVWAPGQPGLHPVYAPALVAFIASRAVPGVGQTIAWFPLAPGEAWKPGFQASQLYVSNVNYGIPPVPGASYAYERRPEALTALPATDFQHGHPTAGSWLRVAGNMLAQAEVVAMPVPAPPTRAPATRTGADVRQATATQVAPVPATQPTPDHSAAASAPNALDARAAQPRAVEESTAQDSAAQQRAAQAKAAAQEHAMQLARQAKAAEEARAEKQRTAAHSRSAEQPRVAQRPHGQVQAKSAMQTHRESATRHTQLAKRETAARRDEARRSQHASDATAVAKRDKTRKAVVARGPDEAQRAHAQQMELARRAAEQDAQTLRDQRLAREQARRDWERRQEVLAEQFRRDQAAYEQQQRQRAAQRPVPVPVIPIPAPAPEIWQRGVPILSPGRTS